MDVFAWAHWKKSWLVESNFAHVRSHPSFELMDSGEVLEGTVVPELASDQRSRSAEPGGFHWIKAEAFTVVTQDAGTKESLHYSSKVGEIRKRR